MRHLQKVFSHCWLVVLYFACAAALPPWRRFVGAISVPLHSIQIIAADNSTRIYNNDQHDRGDDEKFCSSRSNDLDDMLVDFIRQKVGGGGDGESTKRGEFKIQGWRWHTLSLVRDFGRLERLALRENSHQNLTKAVHHVIEFSYKGLTSIETNVFFPWVRQRLTPLMPSPAFEQVLDDMDKERKVVAQLGASVTEQATTASSKSASTAEREEACKQVAQLSNRLSRLSQGLMERQERIIVPAVSALIPIKEQNALNSKVLRNMGVWDSRVHLVGMHDAVWELRPEEKELFVKEIPSIPRFLIPRWRRNLYEPQAGMLEERQKQ